MSFFGSKAPTPREVSKAKLVKQMLVEELGQAVKSLQKDHIEKDEPIYSGDNANAVCNVLEAIFLHETKESLTGVLSSYFTPPVEKAQEINFWPFLKRVTHKDVIIQLETLSQINTEVGRCRAWLRMAVNEGLIESYVDAIIADKNTLRMFYRSIAFLRDSEIADILKTYLQGLGQFTFQLSHNSSMLNIWTHTPLILAGIVTSQDIPNAVKPRARTPNSSSRKLSDSRIVTLSGEEVKHLKHSPEKRRKAVANKTEELQNTANSSQSVLTPKMEVTEEVSSTTQNSSSYNYSLDALGNPPNTPNEVSLLLNNSLQDLENDVYKNSKCTSSPTLTPPNTPLNTIYLTKEKLINNLTTADVETDTFLHNNHRMMRENYGQITDIDQSNNVSEVHTDVDSDLSKHNRDNLNDHLKLQSKLSVHEGHKLSSNTSSTSLLTDDFISSSGSDYATASSSLPQTPKNTPFDPSLLSEITDIRSLTEEVESAIGKKRENVAEVNKDDLLKNMKQISDDEIKSDKSPEPEIAEDACLSIPKSPIHQQADASDSGSFPTQERRRSDPVPPQISSAIAWASKDEGYITRAVEKLKDSANMISQNWFGEEDDTTVTEYGSLQGNKLDVNDMMGWSSAPSEADIDKSHDEEGQSSYKTDETLSGQSNQRGETYDNLLHDYTSPSTLPSPTLESVIEELHVTTNDKKPTNYLAKDKLYLQLSDANKPADFEVVPDTKSNPSFQAYMSVIGEICNEKGLDVQNYQCRGCARPIGMIYGSYRACKYDGYYYCLECHHNDEYFIPSRIVHNWDFRKYKVSKESKCFLVQILEEPVLNIDEMNQRLYDHIDEIKELKILRGQLMSLKAYLFTCQQTIADELRKKIWPKEYLYDNPHIYTLTDLLQVQSGQLAVLLRKIIRWASKHVYECRLCSQKGFICEICDIPKVIYPFEVETTVKCDICRAVFHRDCKDDLKPCPKCDRRRQRQKFVGKAIANTPEITDYAFTPNFTDVDT